MELSQAPKPQKPQSLSWSEWVFHPRATYALYKNLKANLDPKEPFAIRLVRYRELEVALPVQEKGYLKSQLLKGRLTDRNVDDKRSTLAHLYTFQRLERQEGYNGPVLLKDCLRLLERGREVN